MEISCLQLHTTFTDHITCNRRIDSAGKQEHRLTACSDRHSARSRNDLGIDIDFFSDLHIQFKIRMMHIHLHIRACIQNDTAKLTVDLHGAHRIILSGTSCTYLEGLIAFRINCLDIIYDRLGKLFKSLILDINNRADT